MPVGSEQLSYRYTADLTLRDRENRTPLYALIAAGRLEVPITNLFCSFLLGGRFSLCVCEKLSAC